MKTKINFLIPGILLSLISFVSAHTGDDNHMHHNMIEWTGMSFGIGGLWGIIGLLFVAVLVLVIILLSKKINESKK